MVGLNFAVPALLLRAQKALDVLKLKGDEATGADIVRRAIEAPLRTLASNAGVEGALIVEQVKNATGSQGYNVATCKMEDLVASDAVDPTKVTRSALQNAASISGLLLTTKCLITELPEKKEAGGGGHGHDHSGGMDGMM